MIASIEEHAAELQAADDIGCGEPDADHPQDDRAIADLMRSKGWSSAMARQVHDLARQLQHDHPGSFTDADAEREALVHLAQVPVTDTAL